VSDLLTRLASSDAAERNEAIAEACGVDDEAVADAVLALVTDPDAGTPARTAAATALARMPGETGIARLHELLGDDNAALRGIAASGLEYHPDAVTVDALLGALADPVNNVRNLAERSLLAMTCVLIAHGRERLADLLVHPAPLTRSPAARLAGAAELTELVGPLAEMARGDDEWLPRVWASRALGDLGQPGCLDVLEEVANRDEKNRVRAAAAEAIGRLRADRSEAVLREILERDDDAGVRRAAEEALAELQRGEFDGE